jgi:signal transduction histidine kinase
MASRLSHELRTPVAIVNSSLDNLLLEEQSKDSKQYVDRAKQGITRLSKILSNMSEATRLEQAMQSNEREEFDLGEVLKGCVAGYELAYCHRLFALCTSGTAVTLDGSPELFAQMLDKIIANAVEFSEPNSTITVRLNSHSQGSVLSISNLGCLLPENMQDQLLDSMVSVRQQQSSSQPHLGLGLYIAKIIAEYHEGVLSIGNLKGDAGVIVNLVFNQ